MRKKVALVTGLTALVTALASTQAKAATFTETSDAGETINTAQVIAVPGPLDAISGTLDSANEADLFKIFLTNGQTFSATTRNATTDQAAIDAAGGLPTTVALNPQLFLFDANGKGVYGNDDHSGSSQPSLLQNTPLTPQQSGIYYLGISNSGYNPISAGGQIFPPSTLSTFPFNVGPAGPGGQSALTGFSGTGVGSGDYTIALSGAQSISTGGQPVPEPSATLGLLALGAGSAVYGLKKKKKKSQPSPH